MIPFRVRSHFSLQSGAVHIKEYVKKAQELKLNAIALTDINSLSGCVELFREIEKVNKKSEHKIRPIAGIDLMLVNKTQRGFITLLAKNKAGWYILLKILKALEYNHKELTYEFNLELLGLDLINDSNLVRIFADQDAYPHSSQFSEYFLGENIVRWNKEPVLGGTTVNYLNQDDWELYTILLAGKYKTNLDILPTIDKFDVKMAYAGKNNYLNVESDPTNSSDVLFGMTETYSLAGPPQIPTIEGNADQILTDLCRQGWKTRKLNELKPGTELYNVYVARIKEELETLTKYKLSNYMLIIQKFAHFFRQKGLFCGLRGSAVGCIVSYLTNISEVNPIIPDPMLPYHKDRELVFARFLNEGRLAGASNSLPDCDLDVPISARGELIEYIKEEYGEECVASIITFARMDGKKAIQQAFRILGVANHVSITNEITSQMIDSGRVSDELEDLKENDPDYNIIQYCIDNIPAIKNFADEYPNEFKFAAKLNSTITNSSKHAAGVVIADKPLHELFPVVVDPKTGENVLALEMEDAEYVGAVKFDILGVAAYEKIGVILEMIALGLKEPRVYHAPIEEELDEEE